MAQHQPIRKTPPPSGSEIPDKLYFRIGEVSRLCDVPAYVLRFWESEFPQLKPNKGGTGQRLYRRRDVEMALRIKNLLYEEGYTIPGARQVFKAELRHKEPQLALDIKDARNPGHLQTTSQAAERTARPARDSFQARHSRRRASHPLPAQRARNPIAHAAPLAAKALRPLLKLLPDPEAIARSIPHGSPPARGSPRSPTASLPGPGAARRPLSACSA